LRNRNKKFYRRYDVKIHDIIVESLTPKKPIKIKHESGELHIPAEEELLGKNRHYVTVPGQYKLPLRVDMTVKTKFIRTNQIASQLTLYIGRGQVYFNGGHTSAVDVLTADKIEPNIICHNDIPLGEFADISVIFGHEMMWATVNDKVCFVSNKAAYVKLLHENHSMKGVLIAVCGGTDTKLTVKSFAVVEYENDEPDIPQELINLPELSQFELFVKGLPSAIHERLLKLDEYLLTDMKTSMKFRRTIDKTNHLLYSSPCGFQYTIREFGVGEEHETRWVQSPKKPDLTNQVMQELKKTYPEFADKIFRKFQICNPHSRFCERRTTVELNDEFINVCMSKIHFQMHPQDFDDVKRYITAVNKVVIAANVKN